MAKGFDFKIIDNTKQFKKLMQTRGAVALEAVGLYAEGAAKLELENDPRRIDTGLLRNSITHGMDGEAPAMTTYHASFGENRYTKGKNKGKRMSARSKGAGAVNVGRYHGTLPKTKFRAVYIGTNVKYAPHVHEGTRRMKPNRFLRNAVTKNKNTYRKIFIKYLKG